MDILSAVRAQMLSALFSALDQPAALPNPGDKTEARVLRAPDADGVLLVAMNGRQTPLALSQPGPVAPRLAELPDARPALPSSTPQPSLPQAAVIRNPIAAQVPNSGSLERLLVPGAVLSAEIAEDGQSLILTPRDPALLRPGQAAPPIQKGAPLHPEARLMATVEPELLASSRVLGQAALKQQPLPQLLSQLVGLITDQPELAARLPLPTRQAINRILSTEIDGDAPITAQTLKQAVATLTGQETPQPRGGLPAGAEGLKALFQMVRQQITAALPEVPGKENVAREPQAPRGGEAANAAHRPAASAQPDVRQAPPAPRAEALAQAEAGSADEFTASLSRLAEAGESRISLAQHGQRIEALFDPARGEQKALLHVEIPIGLRPDNAAVDLNIERDAGTVAAAEGRIYQARFSIDLPGTGPVHARAGIRGDQLAATIWAEDAETAGRMRALADKLDAALAGQGLEILDLKILHGKPPHRMAVAAGALLSGVA